MDTNTFPQLQLMQLKPLYEIEPSHFPSPVHSLSQHEEEEEEGYESLQMCVSLYKKVRFRNPKKYVSFQRSAVFWPGTLFSDVFKTPAAF